jgi:hypothetical protein
LALAAAALLPFAARAQTTVSGSEQGWGPHRGSEEFTLSGSGTADKRWNNGVGGAGLSFGSYFTDSGELLLRQSVGYSKPGPSGGNAWSGSTRIAFDQHLLGTGPLRPYVGANVGGIYGQTVRDTWAAGLETGLKYYVMPRTFLFAGIEYDWFFRHAHGLIGKQKFRDGEWNYGLGTGFNF